MKRIYNAGVITGGGYEKRYLSVRNVVLSLGVSPTVVACAAKGDVVKVIIEDKSDVTEEKMTTKEPRLICLGNITGGGYERYLEHNRRVYDPRGVSATLVTGMTARINVMDEDKREYDKGICRSE